MIPEVVIMPAFSLIMVPLSVMRDEKTIRTRLEQLRGQFLQWELHEADQQLRVVQSRVCPGLTQTCNRR